ncbi:TRAP-type C4-dicarboxylate transport system substrate-binding protein [Virgibacillus halotolerans]|uniref:TRAP transporter substrate-binding protein DctP n=1 Tax=Virgibacillus halotolerans TaxID=1071053 RepID=UPI001961ED23|nr:TRAP transporter substrate-binding protein DctP [Virgibacillus halotolerans]MBM7599230.1 TRAP-type C4-dicarboxylate transport system substrate-binding protein [Virgibacillus halotolerans]
MRYFNVLKPIIFLLVIVLLAACNYEGKAENGSNNSNEITLNAVSFLPKNNELTATLQEWIDRIDEATEGRVKVNWRGGGEVIPISEQYEAMNSGVVDINFTYVGQYQSMLPESRSIPISQIEPWEERENGFYELMVEQHKNINAMYLGRWLTGSPRLWLNKPIKNMDDLRNMSIRSAPNYSRFFDKLGISSAMIDPSEVYTSLQTGVVEGFVYGGLSGPRRDGWTDSSKYVLDEPFWTQNCVILMNNDKWEEISVEDQRAIIRASADYEKYMVAYYENLYKKERKELEKEGVSFIKLSNREEEKFLKVAYETEWKGLQKDVPELLEELKALTTKE